MLPLLIQSSQAPRIDTVSHMSALGSQFSSCVMRFLSKHKCINRYGFPGSARGEESICRGRRLKRYRLDPWVGKSPCSRERLPTPVFLGFPGGSVVKNLPANAGDIRNTHV